jgi:hypothetical protein
MAGDTVRCRSCGSMCLGNIVPDTCNNCDPEVSKLIADVAEDELTEDDELLGNIPIDFDNDFDPDFDFEEEDDGEYDEQWEDEL